MHSQIFATHDLGNGRAISVYGVESNANSKRSYWPYDINIVEHPKELSDNGMLSFKSKDVHLLERETVNSISTGPKSKYQKTIDEMTARIENPSDEQLEAWKEAKRHRLLRAFGNDVIEGNKAGVDRGLKSGIDINAPGVKSTYQNFHGTPLHVATSTMKNQGMVKHLISRGADVNARDANGNTPLHVAEDTDNGVELLKGGADVTLANDQGELPRQNYVLLDAVVNGDASKVRSAMSIADPKENNSKALLVAIECNKVDVIKELLPHSDISKWGSYVWDGIKPEMKQFIETYYERQALNQALPPIQAQQQGQAITQGRSRGGRL